MKRGIAAQNKNKDSFVSEQNVELNNEDDQQAIEEQNQAEQQNNQE